MSKSSPLLVAAIGVLAVAALCPAQPPLPPAALVGPRPPVSPYLNLLRRGNTPAFNYFTLVRPQNQFISNINQLQQQVGVADQSITTLQQQATGLQQQLTLPPTGRATGFLTHGQFFMTNGRAGGGAAVPAGSAATPTRGSFSSRGRASQPTSAPTSPTRSGG